MHYYASNPSFFLENSLLVCQLLSSELCCEHLVKVGGGGGGRSPPQWCRRSSKSLQLCEDRPGTEMYRMIQKGRLDAPLQRQRNWEILRYCVHFSWCYISFCKVIQVIEITTLNNQECTECMRWCNRRVWQVGSIFQYCIWVPWRECVKDCRYCRSHCTFLLSGDLKPSFRCIQSLWPALGKGEIGEIGENGNFSNFLCHTALEMLCHSDQTFIQFIQGLFSFQASPGKLPGPRCF